MTTDECVALHDRIDALFSNPDRGFGDDMRRVLSLATSRGVPATYAKSAHSLLTELLGRMENDAAELAALDEYVTAMEAEANAAG